MEYDVVIIWYGNNLCRRKSIIVFSPIQRLDIVFDAAKDALIAGISCSVIVLTTGFVGGLCSADRLLTVSKL